MQSFVDDQITSPALSRKAADIFIICDEDHALYDTPSLIDKEAVEFIRAVDVTHPR